MTLFVNYICTWAPDLQHFVVMSYNTSDLSPAVFLALMLVGLSKLLNKLN